MRYTFSYDPTARRALPGLPLGKTHQSETLFPIFAGLHYWVPGMNGRMLNQRLATIEFWLVFVGFNVTFLPMHVTGLLGMPRRYYTYLPGLGWEWLNLGSLLPMALTVGALLWLATLRRRALPATA